MFKHIKHDKNVGNKYLYIPEIILCDSLIYYSKKKMFSTPTRIIPIKNATVSIIFSDDDQHTVISHTERFRLRKKKIIESLDINRLKMSKGRKSKKMNVYTTDELKNTLIALGIGTSGQKSDHIDTLISIRREYDTRGVL